MKRQVPAPVTRSGASGGSFLSKMNMGSLRKIHPSIRPVPAVLWGFTLHMAQLSSLPCKHKLTALTLIIGEPINLHLAK